jgi:hypothetical protein
MDMRDPDQCSERIRDLGGIGHERHCKRKATVETRGRKYCRWHDPEQVERRRAGKEKQPQ